MPTEWLLVVAYAAVVVAVVILVLRWRRRRRAAADATVDDWARSRGWRPLGDDQEVARAVRLDPFGQRSGSARQVVAGRYNNLPVQVGSYEYPVRAGGSLAGMLFPFAALMIPGRSPERRKLGESRVLLADGGWLLVTSARSMTDESDPVRRRVAQAGERVGLKERLGPNDFFDRGTVLDSMAEELTGVVRRWQEQGDPAALGLPRADSSGPTPL